MPAPTAPPRPNRPLQKGVLRQWNDPKAFGWIESGYSRFFVHINDFERGQRRPKAGEEVHFFIGIDAQSRPCARNVTYKNPGKLPTHPGGWVPLGLLLILPTLALLKLPFPPWMGAGAIFVVSWITYSMFRHDKQQAISKGWRTPESTLHLAELLGGWPGSFLAQRKLRHKCSKTEYQIVFHLIVFVHQMVALDFLMDHRLSRAILESLPA